MPKIIAGIGSALVLWSVTGAGAMASGWEDELVGRWTAREADGSAIANVVVEFKKDGAYSVSKTYSPGPKHVGPLPQPYSFRGKWSLVPESGTSKLDKVLKQNDVLMVKQNDTEASLYKIDLKTEVGKKVLSIGEGEHFMGLAKSYTKAP